MIAKCGGVISIVEQDAQFEAIPGNVLKSFQAGEISGSQGCCRFHFDGKAISPGVFDNHIDFHLM